MKIQLHEYDESKSYFSLPVLVEAERLMKATEIVPEGSEPFVAPEGSYVVSIQGVPRSVVDASTFEAQYRKLADMPPHIKNAINSILAWKLGIESENGVHAI